MAVPLDDQPDQAITRRARAVRGEVEHYHSSPRRGNPDELPSEEDIRRFGGVTIACKGCGAVLHDDVAVCWRCGRAVGMFGEESGGRGGWWPMIVAAVLVAALLLAMVL
jgi:hypothetical protein